MLEWDAEWSGPQVIVEVSERATNANTTHIEGMHCTLANFPYLSFIASKWWKHTHTHMQLLFRSTNNFRNLAIEIWNRSVDFFFLLEGPKIIVRTEEVLIVLAVLILWVAAIALFFNRWGKIRMLEPYQPKFQQQHRSSCPLVELEAIPPHKHPSLSRVSMGVSLPAQMTYGRPSISGASSGPNLYTVRGKYRVHCLNHRKCSGMLLQAKKNHFRFKEKLRIASNINTISYHIPWSKIWCNNESTNGLCFYVAVPTGTRKYNLFLPVWFSDCVFFDSHGVFIYYEKIFEQISQTSYIKKTWNVCRTYIEFWCEKCISHI